MNSKPTNITLATFNCRSIKRSAEQLKKLSENVDILVLQETWLLPHDLGFVNGLSQHVQFSCIAKSAVDTSTGILKGRPYGGLALMWCKSLFPSVSIIDCTSDRLAAVQIDLGGRHILVMTVYLPFDDGNEDCLADFIACLGSIEAVITDSDIEAIYVLGDFNAHCGTRFGNELLAFCTDYSLVCVDTEVLAPDTFTHINMTAGLIVG
ncbi:unnamed protein product [Leptidea sinapis]|uniref:Endonuclease/exonuclease/phosphatase domain-containing protein n=1 Tax=Leptidea sinapis TaxID=189913 RepID=A0A5E4PLL9_9NEOP|nr:unnamed protein product [Leptidea sinapis]